MSAADDKPDCKQADAWMVDYLYGELGPAETAAFERHLADCPAHAEEVAGLRSMLEMLRAEKTEPVSQDVSDRILHLARVAEAGEESARAKKPMWMRLVWSPVAAAAVVAVVVVAVGVGVFDKEIEKDIPDTFDARPVARPQANARRGPWTEDPAASEKTVEKEPAGVSGAQKRPAEEGIFAQEIPLAKSPEAVEKPTRRYPRGGKARKRRPAAARRPSAKPGKADKDSSYDSGSDRERTRGRLTVSGGAVAKHEEPQVSDETGGTMDTKDHAETRDDDTGPSREVKKLMEKEKLPAPGLYHSAEARPEKAKPADDEPLRFAKPPPPAPATRSAPEKKAEARPMAGLPVTGAGEDEEMAVESVVDSVAADSAEKRHKRKSARKGSGADADLYAGAERELAAKRYGAAVDKYRRFMAARPSDPRVATCRFRIAKALFLAGSCEEAVKAAGQAVSAAPRHGMAAATLFDQASCLVRLGRVEKARTVYERIIEDYPSYAEEARRGLQRL